MFDSQDASSQVGSVPSKWQELPRQSAEISLGQLPPVTVVASLPGWGVTTWMRQLRRHLHLDQQIQTSWVTSREELEGAVASGKAPDVDVVFIDDLLLPDNDPLWESLEAQATRPASPKFVVASLDSPPKSASKVMTVLHENDLALSTDEVYQLAAINGVSVPPGLFAMLAGRYRGNPELARSHLEQLNSTGQAAVWASSDVRLDIHFASLLSDRITQMASSERADSSLLQALLRASTMRWFSVDLLSVGQDSADAVASHFDRLAALPLGYTRLDGDTGAQVFEWSEGVWDLLQRAGKARQFVPALVPAVNAARSTGHVSLELYSTVETGDLVAAEALVSDNLRFFLLNPPRVLVQAITDLRWEQVSTHPNLLLFIGTHRVRSTGYMQVALRYFQSALKVLNVRDPLTPIERFFIKNRQLYAAVSIGDRAQTLRLLREVTDLVDESADGNLLATTMDERVLADRMTAEMYFPYWAATQVDRLNLAQRFSTVMAAFANTRSRTALSDELTVAAAKVFAGTHDERSDELGTATTDPMVLIELGEDELAREYIRLLTERADAGPSRSGAEALSLTVTALLTPQTLDQHKIRAPLEKSRKFWKDRRPSTTIAAAAALASLAIGDAPGAARLVRSAPRRDWYITTVDAVIKLGTDRAGEAMALLETAEGLCHAPRPRAMTGVLMAVAQMRLGNIGAAQERLESTYVATAPGLVRFAMRAVTVEDFCALTADLTRYSEPLAANLQLAATDARHLHRISSARLTPVDLENLVLLRRGYTNMQIAEARFVSINTVRTQMRLLLRKLEVTNRTAAVAKAERLGAYRTS